jgi:hypothetical protein
MYWSFNNTIITLIRKPGSNCNIKLWKYVLLLFSFENYCYPGIYFLDFIHRHCVFFKPLHSVLSTLAYTFHLCEDLSVCYNVKN